MIAPPCIPCNHYYMSTDKQDEPASAPEKIRGWFAGRLPDEWFVGAPEVLADREEITEPAPAEELPEQSGTIDDAGSPHKQSDGADSQEHPEE